jgi:hypothetical protein
LEALFIAGLLAMAIAAHNASHPPEITAICKDATYSMSKSRSGTCSGHGGVYYFVNGKQKALK